MPNLPFEYHPQAILEAHQAFQLVNKFFGIVAITILSAWSTASAAENQTSS